MSKRSMMLMVAAIVLAQSLVACDDKSSSSNNYQSSDGNGGQVSFGSSGSDDHERYCKQAADAMAQAQRSSQLATEQAANGDYVLSNRNSSDSQNYMNDYNRAMSKANWRCP